MSNKRTVESNGKKFLKTIQFGNRKYKTIFKNRKAYVRNKFKQSLEKLKNDHTC